LSARFPDKKIYVHQISCRAGVYSDYKEKLLDLKYLTNMYAEYGQKNPEWGKQVIDFIQSIQDKIHSSSTDEIEMQLDELTRDFDKMNIDDRAFEIYTQAKEESLFKEQYQLITAVLATKFNSQSYV
jgi:hypothetical protein